MRTEAMQALFGGDAQRGRELLAPDDQLDVFDAAAFGRTERLRAILDADPAQANAFSDDGFTPLHLAIFGEQEEAARLLIDAGADVNAFSTGEIAKVPPVGTARFVKSQSLEQLLLDAGADATYVEG
jgi:ankyrin repeat protein